MLQDILGQIKDKSNIIRKLNYIPWTKNRVGYIGWLGHGNMGDEASYKAIQSTFYSEYFLPYRYHTLMQKSEKIMKRRTYGLVMLGVGTLINCPDWGDLLGQAQKLKYPTVVFGTGVRDPEFWEQIPGEGNLLNDWIPATYKKIINDYAILVEKDLLQ